MGLLDEDRLFPLDGRARDLARGLYADIRDLPIVSPHGHTDPRWFAEDQPFPDPAQLFVTPDHYVFRMLCSQGVALTDLGVPRVDGGPTETDGRKIWRLFARNFHLLRGTPSRLWLDHSFQHVFGIDRPLTRLIDFDLFDVCDIFHDTPYFVNLRPGGDYVAKDLFEAGGIPVVMKALLDAGLMHGDCLTVTGRTMAENLVGREATDREVIRPFDAPLMDRAGFLVLKGNLFDFAIMKTSVISEDFRARYLCQPGHEGVFEGTAFVFDGSADYHDRINDPDLPIDENSILVIRGAGPLGWPGAAEVVNMQPPDRLLKRGIRSLPTLGDGRQSGTADSPSILNASPESAAGGGLAFLRTGDRIRIDLNHGRCDMLVDDAEIARRRAEGLPPVPPSATPWQRIYRETVTQLEDGATIRGAEDFRRISANLPRHNH